MIGHPVADLPDYKRARRSQIVRAARNALRDNDYEQIQMRDVADRADVALGTLYRYFSSKEHVYAAVLDEWAQPVFVNTDTDTRPAEERVRTKVRSILASFERRPGFFKVCMLLQNTTDPNAAQTMTQFANVAARTLAEDLASLGEQSAADTAVMLWGIINTVLSGSILRGYPMADAYRIADAFIDLVVARFPPEQRESGR